jgi:hypothetical protein
MYPVMINREAPHAARQYTDISCEFSRENEI